MRNLGPAPFSSIIDLLPELDRLTAEGWEPNIGLFCRDNRPMIWNVGLRHWTVPEGDVVVKSIHLAEDGTETVISELQNEETLFRYSVGGAGVTLREAMLQALHRARVLTDPVGP